MWFLLRGFSSASINRSLPGSSAKFRQQRPLIPVPQRPTATEIILGWLNGKTGKPRFRPLEIKCHPFSVTPMWLWANSPCQAVGLHTLAQLSVFFFYKRITRQPCSRVQCFKSSFLPVFVRLGDHLERRNNGMHNSDDSEAGCEAVASRRHNHYILDWRQHLPWVCALSPHRDSQPNPQDIASHPLPCNASLESDCDRYNLPCTFSWTGVWLSDNEYLM